MSPLSAIALRVLLCLSLILNGSGYAVASTQMQLAHMAMATTSHADGTMSMDMAAGSSCHSQQDASPPPAADAAQTSSHHHGKASDCCQFALCVCDCMQHASAAIVGPQVSGPLIAPAPSLHPLQIGHATPMLANPIRPPIA